MKNNKFDEVSNEAEGFYMEDGESHEDMYRRLKALATTFKNLGAHYVDDVWVKRKYIKALMPLEPTDLKNLKRRHNFDQMSSSDVMQEMAAFKVVTKNAEDDRARALGMRKGTNLTLKAKVVEYEEEEMEEEVHDERSVDDIKFDYNEHMALAARTFWRDGKFKAKGNLRSDSSGQRQSVLRVRTCYNCNNKNHFIADCPYENKEDHGGKLIPKNKSKFIHKKPFVKKNLPNKKPSKILLVTREEFSSGEEEDDD